ncbi:MAG TPA: aminofutalosine synthase MqnE [Planctomycetota bacterium]|nr:aminofutalosine synthase MqnE [Planctomycetota bacterium]
MSHTLEAAPRVLREESGDLPDVSAPELKAIREKVLAGKRLSREDGLTLFQTRDVLGLGALAAYVARQKQGRSVYYVVNGHINYSNYCTLSCAFCSFYRRKGKDRRAGGYEMSLEEVFRHADEIAAGGATEIHSVGGLHPDFPFSYYTGMLSGIKQRQPRVGLKFFTAIEIYHIATIAGLSPRETLIALKEAGLDTLPGGGAEILDDGLRKKICAGKETSAEYLDLHRTAHQVGIKSNATMLYGHLETLEMRVDHLLQLRALQDETQGFLAFIPLSYHPDNNVLKVEHGPSGLDEVRNYAASRLLLDNFPHVKAYWIMLSIPIAQVTLAYGATDFDGTVLQEKIYHMAGAQTPQALTVKDLRRLIEEAGGVPVERDHLYRKIERGGGGPLDWNAAAN